MSTTTTKLGLVKPALTDSPPDITAINPNFDKIDNVYGFTNNIISTGGTASAYTATVPNFTYTVGSIVALAFNRANLANATLNINGLGAKYIFSKAISGSPVSAGYIKEFDVLLLQYRQVYTDAYAFIIIGPKSFDYNYSTNEVIIGRYADGKPIYRKCYYGNMDVASKTLTAPSSMKRLLCSNIHLGGSSQGQQCELRLLDSGSSNCARMNSGTIYLYAPGGYYGTDCWYDIKLEYTKSTDY